MSKQGDFMDGIESGRSPGGEPAPGDGLSPPHTYEPEVFLPQELEPGMLEPVDLEPEADARGAVTSPAYPPAYGLQPYDPSASAVSRVQTGGSMDYSDTPVHGDPRDIRTTSLPASTERNWMGIAAIVSALVGLALVGMVLGWQGIVAAREGRATNGRTARVGVVLSVVSLLVLVGVGVVAMGTGSGKGASPTEWATLAIGECVNQVPGGTSSAPVLLPQKVSCQESHWGQVYFKATATGDAYPGGAELGQQANVCVSEMATRNLDPANIADAYPTVIVPTEESWAEKDRAIVCVVSNAAGSITGSWAVES